MVDSCCAQTSSHWASQWAMMHFGNADLGDKRRSQRLVRLAASVVEQPAMSLPKLLPDWSDLLAAYRLLSNEQVFPEDILAPHVKLTRSLASAHRVVLCVQDDTQLDFSLRTGVRGLGLVGDGGGRGLWQHSSLAVLPDKSLLGILDICWHALEKSPKGQTRRQRQARWNLPDLWPDAAHAIGQWPSNSRLIHVCDRQADLFRFMQKLTELGHGYVIRAVHNRYLVPEMPEQSQRLREKLASAEPLGCRQVEVGCQRNKGNQVMREPRQAQLTIRVTSIEIPPPKNDPRTAEAGPLKMQAIQVIEEHPPAGEQAVEWMLLTSEAIETLADAVRVIEYYTCRWVIEEWHRSLKQGCQLEESQLDDALDIQRLAAILCPVAVRLVQMRDMADAAQRDARSDTPEALARAVPVLYVMVVAGLAKVKPQTLTPGLFYRTIAKRGGWLGRKNDLRPGWLVMWRGWNDVVQMVRGAELYQELLQSRESCV